MGNQVDGVTWVRTNWGHSHTNGSHFEGADKCLTWTLSLCVSFCGRFHKFWNRP